MKNKKILGKLRRALRTRAKICTLKRNRLCVHRTLNHIYAQVISSDNSQVLVSASTAEKIMKSKVQYGGNIKAAVEVGRLVAERALAADVSRVSFDRSGYRYHGRVKALAEAARSAGMEF